MLTKAMVEATAERVTPGPPPPDRIQLEVSLEEATMIHALLGHVTTSKAQALFGVEPGGVYWALKGAGIDSVGRFRPSEIKGLYA